MATTKKETARYVSRYRMLRIPIKSAYYKEIEGKRTMVPGNSIRFNEGMFETTDENLINELESRADFGTAFIKVPTNKTVEDMKDRVRGIDERERELAAREAELANREKKINGDEEGAGTGSTDEDSDLPKLSERMTVSDIVEIAKEEGVEVDPDKETKADMIEAIKAKRAEGQNDEGAFNE